MSEAVLLMLCVAVTLIAVGTMSDDLVKRLRDPSLGSTRWMDTIEAADRIAELEAALQRIASAGGLFAEPASGQHAREIARAALEGGKE